MATALGHVEARVSLDGSALLSSRHLNTRIFERLMGQTTGFEEVEQTAHRRFRDTLAAPDAGSQRGIESLLPKQHTV